MAEARGRITTTLDRLGAVPPLDIVPKLTLITVLFSPSISGAPHPISTPLFAIAVVGLVTQNLHRSAVLWGLLTLVLAIKCVTEYITQDNHGYLFTYWSLALCLTFALGEPRRVMAANARWLIGLPFALAVLWKGLISQTFNDGSYMLYTVLSDPRFHDFAVLAGGMTDAATQANYADITGRLLAPMSTVAEVQLDVTEQMKLVAKLMTWWTLAIEGAIAVTFLAPGENALTRWRHALLMIFAISTYLIATVSAFGWTLMALGIAQCDERHTRTRAAYLITALIVMIYTYAPPLEIFRAVTGL